MIWGLKAESAPTELMLLVKLAASGLASGSYSKPKTPKWPKVGTIYRL